MMDGVCISGEGALFGIWRIGRGAWSMKKLPPFHFPSKRCWTVFLATNGTKWPDRTGLYAISIICWHGDVKKRRSRWPRSTGAMRSWCEKSSKLSRRDRRRSLLFRTSIICILICFRRHVLWHIFHCFVWRCESRWSRLCLERKRSYTVDGGLLRGAFHMLVPDQLMLNVGVTTRWCWAFENVKPLKLRESQVPCTITRSNWKRDASQCCEPRSVPLSYLR